MPNASSPDPSLRIFVGALLRGLGWGIASATVIATAFAIVSPQFGAGEIGPRHVLEIVAWTAMIASILAIVPIGPMAGIVGWQLYRRGVVSPAAYAGVGAVSAALAPLLVIAAATATMRYAPPTTNYAVISEGVVPMFALGFAVVGAFGGFMAGRALQLRAQP